MVMKCQHEDMRLNNMLMTVEDILVPDKLSLSKPIIIILLCKMYVHNATLGFNQIIHTLAY